jgi:uncharacterized membrane protein
MSLSPRRSLGGAARLRPLVTGAFVVSGATLLYRRLTRRPRAAARRGHLERAITVSRPAGELHRLAAAPDTLPRILQPYLDASVSEDGRLVHLHAPGALRRTLAWQAQVVDDVPGVRRRWRATDGGAPVEVAVSFRPAPGSWGTEVHLDLELGAHRLPFTTLPRLALEKVLRNFKALAETGEIPTTRQQPAARAVRD